MSAVSPSERATAERIPSLDGLRAISIMLVLIGHIAGTGGAPATLMTLRTSSWVNLGDLGVRVFFVISGLLITTLLLEEQATYGRISLGRFFLRRTFRIFPAFLALLLGLWIAQTRGWITLGGADWTHALTYTVNYHPERPWVIGHLWSLSVEEQFYAIWPLLLLLAGIRRGMLYAAAIVCVAPILRLVYLRYLPNGGDYAGITFETAADSLAIGCLLAWLRDRLWANERWRRSISTPWLAPAVLIAASLLHARTQLAFLLGATAMNIAIALFIERSIRLPDRGLPRLLNTRPLIFLGMLSYSLYLWQQPFLNRESSAFITQFPQNVLFALVGAIACFYLIERPALALRRRIEHKLPRRVPVESIKRG